ncbi:methylmalonyl-CoA mutase family protein [Ilyomonas limi]|uniref:methylmalonyl-CoA mutase family protein n=1 Tax=Ilyomonas limi TaxID=2575867 RepID=UPI0029392B86|nr:methylmalonyl-CoA mutase family protein [Ilyomonas limi]
MMLRFHAQTADPLGGAYFIENLTDEMEANATALITQIDAMGSSISAIESGFMQEQIARSAYEYQQQIESGDKIIVGVNKFWSEEATMPPFKIDESIRIIQTEQLKALKEKRNNEQVNHCLQQIKIGAQGTANLMPLVIAAVENFCTLGEISDVLRGVFGEYK